MMLFKRKLKRLICMTMLMIFSFTTFASAAGKPVAILSENSEAVSNIKWISGSTATLGWDGPVWANYYDVEVSLKSFRNVLTGEERELGSMTTGTTECEIDLQQEINNLIKNTDYEGMFVYVNVSVCPVHYTDGKVDHIGEKNMLGDFLYTIKSKTLSTPHDISITDDGLLTFTIDDPWDVSDVEISLTKPDEKKRYYTELRFIGGSVIDSSGAYEKRSGSLHSNYFNMSVVYTLDGNTVTVDISEMVKKELAYANITGDTKVRVYLSTCNNAQATSQAIHSAKSEWSDIFTVTNYDTNDETAVITGVTLAENGIASWNAVKKDSTIKYEIDVKYEQGSDMQYLLTSIKDSYVEYKDGRAYADITKLLKAAYWNSRFSGMVDLSIQVRRVYQTTDGINGETRYSDFSNSITKDYNKIEMPVPQNMDLHEDGILEFDIDDFTNIDEYNVSALAYDDNGVRLNSYSPWDISVNEDRKTGHCTINAASVIKDLYLRMKEPGTVNIRVGLSVGKKIDTGIGVYSYNYVGDSMHESNSIRYNGTIPVKSIAIAPAHPIVALGHSYTLGKTIMPLSAEYEDIEWSVSDNSVISIDRNGRITGNKCGETTITARIGEVSTTVSANVYTVESNIADENEKNNLEEQAKDVIDDIVNNENPNLDSTDINEDELTDIKDDIQEGIWRGDQFFIDMKFYEENFLKYKDNWGQIQKAAKNMNAQFEGAYNIEVEMYHKDDAAKEYHIGNITELEDEVTFTFDLPTGSKNHEGGEAKKYVLVRIHNNQVEKLDVQVNGDGTFSAKSDKYSDFVLVSVYDNNESTPEGATPDGTTPEGITPDGTTPEGTTPDGTTPEGATPEGTPSDGTAPEGTPSDGTTPEGTSAPVSTGIPTDVIATVDGRTIVTVAVPIACKQKVDISKYLKHMGVTDIKSIKFTSSDKKVASVNGKGIVIGKKKSGKGDVKITVADKKDKTKVYGIIELSVVAPSVVKKLLVTLSDDTDKQVKKLSDYFTGEGLTPANFVSSKPSVATVDNKTGAITIVATQKGSAKISFIVGEGKTAVKYKITVKVK